MEWIFYIAIFLLGVVFWQDIKSRAIWWFLPLMIFVSGIFVRSSIVEYVDILWNVFFVGGMMILLAGYVRIRFGKRINEFARYFALGDVLMLLAITPFFPFGTFVYIFTFGTCFSLLAHIVASIFKAQKTVPYAGYLSLFIASVLLIDRFNLLNLVL